MVSRIVNRMNPETNTATLFGAHSYSMSHVILLLNVLKIVLTESKPARLVAIAVNDYDIQLYVAPCIDYSDREIKLSIKQTVQGQLPNSKSLAQFSLCACVQNGSDF